MPFSERAQQLQRNPGKPVDPGSKGNHGNLEDNNVRVIEVGADAVNARELGSRREDEKPRDANGKPAQLQPLDRSVEAQATLTPDAGGRQRDEQAQQQEIRRKEEERQQNVNAQNKLDEQAAQQESQRKEEERQQNVNAQNKRDEQAPQEQVPAQDEAAPVDDGKPRRRKHGDKGDDGNR